MRRVLQGILFCGMALFAQQATAPAPAGLETPWDIAPVLLAVSAHSTRLLAELNRLDPNTWLEKGASPTYAEQLQACKDQVKAVADTATTLAHSPEHLPDLLELLIRMQGVDTMLGSVQEAIRKYQDPARAQDIVRVVAEGSADRDRFQQYLVSLAADREHSLQVMDKEAQRCRGLLAQPCTATKTGKKK